MWIRRVYIKELFFFFIKGQLFQVLVFLSITESATNCCQFAINSLYIETYVLQHFIKTINLLNLNKAITTLAENLTVISFYTDTLLSHNVSHY